MNKIRVTEKQLKNAYQFIIKAGYCDIWYLLQSKQPQYYTCGVYGWKADNYHISNNLLISTGYAPIGNIDASYKTNNKYNEKAKAIYNNDEKWEIKQKKIDKLLNKYIKEVLENEK